MVPHKIIKIEIKELGNVRGFTCHLFISRAPSERLTGQELHDLRCMLDAEIPGTSWGILVCHFIMSVFVQFSDLDVHFPNLVLPLWL